MRIHRNIIPIATLSLALHLANTPTEAGLIDLLKGTEPTPSPALSYQRVAFVGSAEVKEIQGKAAKLVGVDQWTALEQGKELQPGDIIRTDEGRVVLRFKESDSMVRVTPHTIVRLVPMRADWDPSVISGREERTGYIVRAVRGRAYYQNQGGNWKLLTVNTVLEPGVQVRTNPSSLVDFYHPVRGEAFRIDASSQFILNQQLAGRYLVTPPVLAAAGGR